MVGTLGLFRCPSLVPFDIRALSCVLLMGCSAHRASPAATGPSPTPETPEVGSHASLLSWEEPAAAQNNRDRYVGHRVGVEIHHAGQPTFGRLELPPDLAYVAHISFADGHDYITATERGALTILVAREGRVVRDLRLVGMANLVLHSGCTSGESDAELLALVPAHACEGADEVSPSKLWERRGSTLVPSFAQATCFCMS